MLSKCSLLFESAILSKITSRGLSYSMALVVAVDGISVHVIVKQFQELCSTLDRLRRTECIVKISKRKRKGHKIKPSFSESAILSKITSRGLSYSMALVVAVDGISVHVIVKQFQELCSTLDRLRRTECIVKISKRKRKGHKIKLS